MNVDTARNAQVKKGVTNRGAKEGSRSDQQLEEMGNDVGNPSLTVWSPAKEMRTVRKQGTRNHTCIRGDKRLRLGMPGDLLEWMTTKMSMNSKALAHMAVDEGDQDDFRKVMGMDGIDEDPVPDGESIFDLEEMLIPKSLPESLST